MEPACPQAGAVFPAPAEGTPAPTLWRWQQMEPACPQAGAVFAAPA
jgi:hypothetical protein